MHTVRLSIILVNYKTKQLLLNCLRSVYSFDTSEIEIIVVDNDSGDDINAVINQKYPEIIFMQMGYNAGFARANNAAIKIARGDQVLLLNTDTIVLNDAVNRCDVMLRQSEYAVAGVQLLNEDGSPQISGNYAMRGGLNYLLPLPYIGPFLKAIAGLAGTKAPSIKSTDTTVEVDWINGAFLMFKKNIIARSGLMDEDFFLYAEEAEWCSRIKKYGRLCIFGEINVLHLQGASSNEAFGSEGKGYFNLYDRKGLQIMLSNFVRIRKQFGVAWMIFDFLVYFFTIPVMLTGSILSLPFKFKDRKAMMFRLRGFTYNVFELISFLPRIIKNRPYFYKVL